MARWQEKAAAEQAAEQPQQLPGEEPIPPRKVEHSGLCAKQFNRNALCDCKSR